MRRTSFNNPPGEAPRKSPKSDQRISLSDKGDDKSRGSQKLFRRTVSSEQRLDRRENCDNKTPGLADSPRIADLGFTTSRVSRFLFVGTCSGDPLVDCCESELVDVAAAGELHIALYLSQLDDKRLDHVVESVEKAKQYSRFRNLDDGVITRLGSVIKCINYEYSIRSIRNEFQSLVRKCESDGVRLASDRLAEYLLLLMIKSDYPEWVSDRVSVEKYAYEATARALQKLDVHSRQTILSLMSNENVLFVLRGRYASQEKRAPGEIARELEGDGVDRDMISECKQRLHNFKIKVLVRCEARCASLKGEELCDLVKEETELQQIANLLVIDGRIGDCEEAEIKQLMPTIIDDLIKILEQHLTQERLAEASVGELQMLRDAAVTLNLDAKIARCFRSKLDSYRKLLRETFFAFYANDIEHCYHLCGSGEISTLLDRLLQVMCDMDENHDIDHCLAHCQALQPNNQGARQVMLRQLFERTLSQMLPEEQEYLRRSMGRPLLKHLELELSAICRKKNGYASYADSWKARKRYTKESEARFLAEMIVTAREFIAARKGNAAVKYSTEWSIPSATERRVVKEAILDVYGI